MAKQVLNELEQCIRDGRWAVGSKIPPEPELAALFDVSRNTIREALQSLIHGGLLQARPGDGTYVLAHSRLEAIIHNQLNDTEFARILEARLALEREIASLAAENRTESDLRELSELLARRNETGAVADDVQFHAAVAQATGNHILSGFYDVICQYMANHMPQKLNEQQKEAENSLHNGLFEAIKNQDSHQAVSLTCEIVNFYSVRQTSTRSNS